MHLKNFPKRLDSKTSCLRITVPENLDLALEGLIRKVLREQPKTDYIHSFAAEYFETLLKIRDKAGAKYTSEQLCPFHNDEDAHEMIKLANAFNKPSKKSHKEYPQAKNKMVESGISGRRTNRAKAKQGKQTTPDLIKKLPGNRPEEKHKSEKGEKENHEEELLSGDPIKELVEKELEMEALAKRTKVKGKDKGAENTEEEVKGDNGRSEATEEKKRTDDAKEPTDGKEAREMVESSAAEETVVKDKHSADEMETKRTEEMPIEEKVTNGQIVEGKPSTTEKDSEMTDKIPAAEEHTAVKKDDGDKLPSDGLEAKTPSPTVEDKLPTAKEDRNSEIVAEVNKEVRNGDGRTETALKEAKDEEKEHKNSPRQLMTGNDGTESHPEERSHSKKEDKAAEMQEKSETEINIEAEEANVEETLKTASAPTEDTDEQKINAENASQQQKQQENKVEQKQQEPGMEQKEKELGMEQKEQEPGMEQKEKELGMEQKQQERGEEQKEQEPGMEQKEKELGMEQKEQERGEEQKEQEPGMEQKEQEPGVEQKEQEPGMEQKEKELGMEQKQQERGEEQKEQEPGMEQKEQEPGVEQKEQEPGVEQKEQEPGMEQKEQEPGVEQKEQEPGAEQKKQEPGVEQKEQEPGVEQKEQEPGVEQKEQEPGAEQKKQEPGVEQKEQEPGMEQKEQEPGMEQKEKELGMEQKEQEPGVEQKQPKTGRNSENEEKPPTEEDSSEKTETAKPEKKEKSKTEEEVLANKENVTFLTTEAAEVIPIAEEMLSKEEESALLKSKEDNKVNGLDRPEQQEKDDVSKADTTATEKLLKEPEDADLNREAEDASPSTNGTAALEKAEEPDPKEDTKPDIKEIQNEKQRDELNTTIDTQQGAPEDEQKDDIKQQEEELCTVVDSQHIIRIEDSETAPDDPGVAPPPEEVQIRTIQTHYYDALQVPEIVTKEFRVRNVGAPSSEDSAKVEENNSGSSEAQLDGERTETPRQTTDSAEKRPDDVPLLVTTPGQQELGSDTVRSDDLLDLMTPTSGYSLNLSELSWQTVNGLFLDSERLHSSQMSDELRYKTDIDKPEERDEIEEVFHRTVVPTLVGAVPMPPRDAEEIDKESDSSLEEKKDNKKLEDVSNSKSFDSDTPFISVEVKTVIETQVLDDEDEEEGRPRVELTVLATVDVEDVGETTKTQQNLPEGEEKEMSEGQEKGGSGESDSTMSSAATEIKRSDPGRRSVGVPGSLMQSQSLDLGGRNPLLRTRSLSTFRHGVTDFEVWSAIEKELEEAATKIQAKFRSYKARKKLQREDAVQITTEESSPSTTPAEADERQQSTGEFHDSIVLSDHPR